MEGLSSITKNEFLEKQLETIKDIQNGDSTWQNLTDIRAEYYGERFHNDTTRRGGLLLREYLENGWIKKPVEDDGDTLPNKSQIEINKDGSQSSSKIIKMTEKDSKNCDFLLEAHGYDKNVWEIVNAKSSVWNAYNKTDGVIEMYSSKITVKPRSGLNYGKIVEYFDGFAKNYKPVDVIPKQYEYGAECLIPCFYDVHFAKLADVDECGERYDYKIAKQRVIDSVKQYINRLSDRKFEKIIFAIGNDYFNSEPTGSTVNNTPQDNDTRYSKMFNKGVETLIETIDLFSNVSPVEVILVQGNHSFYTEFFASCVLSAWYKDSSVVKVDNSPTVRKYIEFGKNLIGFTHGSEEKERIYGLMQHEAAEAWGRCSGAKEWLIGHLHSEGVTEKNGIVVRRIPSLTGLDAWHKKVGFTMSKKRTMAFIYDKEQGLVETHYVNI